MTQILDAWNTNIQRYTFVMSDVDLVSCRGAQTLHCEITRSKYDCTQKVDEQMESRVPLVDSTAIAYTKKSYSAGYIMSSKSIDHETDVDQEY